MARWQPVAASIHKWGIGYKCYGFWITFWVPLKSVSKLCFVLSVRDCFDFFFSTLQYSPKLEKTIFLFFSELILFLLGKHDAFPLCRSQCGSVYHFSLVSLCLHHSFEWSLFQIITSTDETWVWWGLFLLRWTLTSFHKENNVATVKTETKVEGREIQLWKG